MGENPNCNDAAPEADRDAPMVPAATGAAHAGLASLKIEPANPYAWGFSVHPRIGSCQINCEAFEVSERTVSQRTFVSSTQDHAGRLVSRESLLPAGRT